MDINQRIYELTDDAAKNCLNDVLAGMVATSPNFEEVLSTPDGEDSADFLRTTAAQVSVTAPGKIAENNIIDPGLAIKSILIEMAANSELRPRIENWLAQPERAELFEPITTALVLAGIVAVLSTDVEFSYEDQGGKKHLKIAVHKKPNTEKLLSKFFTLFGK